MGWEPKLHSINMLRRREVRELQELVINVENGAIVEIDLSPYLEETLTLHQILSPRDIKRELKIQVEAAFNAHGVPNPTGRKAKRSTRVKNEVNRLYGEAVKNVRYEKYEQDILENYEQFGLWGLEQIRIIEAIAQVGDGGSVVQPETRYITRNGFEMAQAWVDMVRLNAVPDSVQRYLRKKHTGKAYEDAVVIWRKARKRLYDKAEPPIVDIMRASLEGKRLSGLNLLLTRGHTHTWGSAMMNGLNRAFAVKGEEEEARGLIREYVRLYSTGKTRQSDRQRRLRARLPGVHLDAIAAREKLWRKVVEDVECRPNWRTQRVIVVGVSGDIIDPTGGLRGLIAGQLAARYKDRVVVVYDMQKRGGANSKSPAIIGLSGRLPADGNVELDMVFREIEYNPPIHGRVKVLACGGHPCAAGARVSVVLNPEDPGATIQGELEKTLAPLLRSYQPTNRDRGIVDADNVIDRAFRKLQEQGFADIWQYRNTVNAFELVQDLAEISYKTLDPYGSDLENLRMKINSVRVLSVSQGRKKDDTAYTYLHVKDDNGHSMRMRVFPGEVNLRGIKSGDILSLTVEGRVRRRPLGVSKMTRKRPWTLPGRPGHPKSVETEYWASQKVVSRLFITEIERGASEI